MGIFHSICTIILLSINSQRHTQNACYSSWSVRLFLWLAILQTINCKYLIDDSPFIIQYPPATKISKCLAILTTNVLAPSECPLPPSCGESTFISVSDTWYGQETGICYGTTFRLPKNVDHNSSSIIDGWISLRVLYNEDNSGFENEIFAVAKFPNEHCILTNFQTEYAPIFNHESHTISFNPKHKKALIEHHCNPTLTPAQTAPIYCRSTVDELLADFPHNMITASTTNFPIVIGTSTALNHDFKIIDLDTNIRCIPIVTSTSYSLPGLLKVEKLVLTLIEKSVEIVFDASFTLLLDIVDQLHNLNYKYYLTEYALLAIITLHYLKRTLHRTLVLIITLYISGIKRRHAFNTTNIDE